MARDTRARFLEALAPVLTQFERAFLEAVMDIRSAAMQATIEEIIRRYDETRDLEAAVSDLRAALNFGMRGLYAPLDQAYDAGVLTGALYQTDFAPKRHPGTGARLVVRFDGRHERAEAISRRLGGRLITEITRDQETVIRETITEGIETQRSYRRITTDLIGTPQGNKRKGGLIGLHSRQAAAVRAARRDLEALDSSYFSRARRDRRFDRTVAKAIREGTPLDRATIDRITGRYSDRLLQLRAETISRTESNKAMNAGRHEATQQMIDNGTVPASAVTKTWRATVGKFTRDHHVALNGRTVGWGEPFISPATGYPMQHPHDENAPGADTINCRCVELVETDWLSLAV